MRVKSPMGTSRRSAVCASSTPDLRISSSQLRRGDRCTDSEKACCNRQHTRPKQAEAHLVVAVVGLIAVRVSRESRVTNSSSRPC